MQNFTELGSNLCFLKFCLGFAFKIFQLLEYKNVNIQAIIVRLFWLEKNNWSKTFVHETFKLLSEKWYKIFKNKVVSLR